MSVIRQILLYLIVHVLYIQEKYATVRLAVGYLEHFINNTRNKGNK